MKVVVVANLSPNEVVTAQFLVLVKEIRQKKAGDPYLHLHLADRTGEIEAKMWDNVAEVMNTFERDDFVKVKGLVQIHQNRSQFTIHRLRRLEEHEVDLADYFPCSERDPEEMFLELRGIVDGVANLHLRALLQCVFNDPELTALYKFAPAAKSIHHACRGGLLEHVLSLCKLASYAASHYKDIDRDLLIAGAILHDIGKVEELSYARSFGYSADGQLLGHIVLGLRLLNGKFEQVPNFPHKLRTLLEHMIISHHGELEFGSPKVPIFPEALLLHHLDNMDSKMDAARSALRRDPLVDGEFTGWIGSLERVLLKKQRYMDGSKLDGPQAEAQIPVAVETAGENSTEIPPAAPTSPPPEPAPKIEIKPAPLTLFGEKLQAVLDSRK